MDSIFIFLDRIYRIDGILLTCSEMPSAEGRSILTILLILSNCFSNIRIHSSYLRPPEVSLVVRGWGKVRQPELKGSCLHLVLNTFFSIERSVSIIRHSPIVIRHSLPLLTCKAPPNQSLFALINDNDFRDYHW